ncbi:hypothetical protein ARMSODRAFT_553839 [Armillaria solidipes]|uniref:Mid2 domain-containing protein n=1 Tax=Armillaria solidipes TaxID=1076256 RepID=A0A2H3BGZ7_9AGAR|nr:hypothetical protein ARMSODRAFT_553839 [Armillaria solidipes]
MTSLLKTLFCLSFMLPFVFAQDPTQCVDSGSDWYTSVVGETPCRTYERLRKLCNSQYVLGVLIPKTPGAPPDTCDDQIADCCCNSIAFGLSMMCLTCQQGIGNGNGIDAGVGAYQRYLQHGTNSFCTPNTNLSFTTNIQTAVCNNELKIHDNFYDRVFWSDGSWFYTWSRERMETTNAADGNNSFTHCASTTLNSTSVPKSTSSLSSMISLTESSAASAISTSTLPRPSKTLGAGAIAGIVVGIIAFVGAIMLFFLWLFSNRRRQADTEDSEPETAPTPFTISDDSYTPSMSSSAGTPMLTTNNPGSGAGRRLRMKEQMEAPPRYTE